MSSLSELGKYNLMLLRTGGSILIFIHTPATYLLPLKWYLEKKAIKSWPNLIFYWNFHMWSVRLAWLCVVCDLQSACIVVCVCLSLLCTLSCCWNFLHGDWCRFLLKFTGKEDEINLLGDGTEKPEFGEWSWMSPDQVIERVGRT